MNLFEQRPEVLADQSNPQAVMDQLRLMENLNSKQQSRLDYALTDWVMMVLSRFDDIEGVVELHECCSLAQSFLDNSEGAAQFRVRWEGFADLLEGKRLAIRARNSSRRMELLQEPVILDYLQQHGEVKQSALADLVKLTPGRISQVLGVLEGRGQITRKRRGKESCVSLMQTKRLHDTAPPASRLTAESPKVPYLCAPPARAGAIMFTSA